MRFYSDNPVRDAAMYEAEQQQRLSELPECCYCSEPIQDEFAYLIDGEWVCEDCLNDQFRKPVCDY